jgi:hypothetical protein
VNHLRARTYKRDSDGKFASGSGLTEADFDAAPTGAAALAALPGSYDSVIRQAQDRRRDGLRPREAIELADAVHGEHGYARDGYIETNRALYEARGRGIDGAPEHVQQQVASLDRLTHMSRTGQDIVVHRGTSEPGRVIPGFKSEGGNEGLEWTHHAFQSTSARHEIAEEFARGHNASALHRGEENHPTAIRIMVPRGTGAIQLTGMDRYEGEGDGTGYAEVLLQRGLRHRVVNDYGVVNGVHFLDVEVVAE